MAVAWYAVALRSKGRRPRLDDYQMHFLCGYARRYDCLDFQFCIVSRVLFVSFTPIDVDVQEAVAISFDTERQRLDSPECYHNSIATELRPKRDKMAKFLEEVGMVPTVPEGGYFMVADFSNLSRFATAVEFT